MKTPEDLDPRTLRFVAELADTEARVLSRLADDMTAKELYSSAAAYNSRAETVAAFGRRLRNRATRVEKAQRAGLADEVLS